MRPLPPFSPPLIRLARRRVIPRACASIIWTSFALEMIKQFGYKNVHAGAEDHERWSSTWASARASTDTQEGDVRLPADLALIAGQKPVVTRSRKAIASFKLRDDHADRHQGHIAQAHACTNFMDRLVTIALPRIRDFRGLNPKSVRRPRQLFAIGVKEHHRVPGNRLRQGRRFAAWHGHHRLHERAKYRRRSARVCCAAFQLPVPAVRGLSSRPQTRK